MSSKPDLQPTCLCIELDADFYYLIQSYAERSGLSAILVQRGKDLLATIRQIRPAVICLEPEQHAEQSSWEILHELKSEPQAKLIPVVLFSWLDEENKAREVGAEVYVRKPVMYVDFQEALRKAGIR